MIIADDFTIISTSGIRFVEKLDRQFGSGLPTYHLDITYKGSKLSYKYPTVEARDAQFDRLRKAMVKDDPS